MAAARLTGATVSSDLFFEYIPKDAQTKTNGKIGFRSRKSTAILMPAATIIITAAQIEGLTPHPPHLFTSSVTETLMIHATVVQDA